MRKKLGVLVAIFFAFASLFLVGCNQNSNNKPPKVSSDMLSPRVISFGNFLSWDEVEYATDYEVYRNGELQETVQDTIYRLNDNCDAEYYVVAIDKKSNEKTEKSNVVTTSKNSNYEKSETLDLSDKMSYSATLPATIRKVIISNVSNFKLEITIAERTNDVTFELNNTSIIGFITVANGSYKRADNDYNVIFDVTGECALSGEVGHAGFDYSDAIYNNREIDAGNGGTGGSPLLAPSVVVCGNGNLMIVGGNGGDGGVGSATTKWEAENGPGTGSDGGDGGSAITCSYLVLDMANDDCKLGIRDGVGGKKGTPGNNGSIITGPMASAMWKDMYDIGKAGKNGKSKIGTKRIINGVLN